MWSGLVITNEHRLKISKGNKGKKHPHRKRLSLENKRKLSVAHIGQKPWNKTKIQCIQNGVIYNSTHEAAKQLGISQGLVSQVLNGKRKHTKGFSFVRYINE